MSIDKYDDIIDSRDVIARIDELRAERVDWVSEDSSRDGGDWTGEEAEELAALESLAEEASGYAEDWAYGETLIRDSYFREYAEELAEDIGAVNPDAMWPNTCIDWEQAARELQYDYTSVDFGGVTYWVR